MNTVLLTPIQEPGTVAKGRPPHARYRLIRSKFEDIVMSRDVLRLSDRAAAKRVGLRGAKEFAQAYELLKQNGARIMAANDWEGVEAGVYARFPRYRNDRRFHEIQTEFADPRPKLGLETMTEAPATLPPEAAAAETPRATDPRAPVATPSATQERRPWGGKDPRRTAFPSV